VTRSYAAANVEREELESKLADPWRERAGCLGLPTSIVWSTAPADEAIVLDACSTCPVKTECLADAYEAEAGVSDEWLVHFVRGGLTARERVGLPRREAKTCASCGEPFHPTRGESFSYCTRPDCVTERKAAALVRRRELDRIRGTKRRAARKAQR